MRLKVTQVRHRSVTPTSSRRSRPQLLRTKTTTVHDLVTPMSPPTRQSAKLSVVRCMPQPAATRRSVFRSPLAVNSPTPTPAASCR